MNEEAAAAAHLEEVAFQRGRAEGRLTAMADSEARGYAAGVAEAVEMAVEMMDGIAQERVEFSDAYRRLVAQKADLDAVLARLRKGNADA